MAQPWHREISQQSHDHWPLPITVPWQQKIWDGLDTDSLSYVIGHSLQKRDLVRLAGIEPTTLGFGGQKNCCVSIAIFALKK
ncbi:MAG: hypothetical protein NDI95_09525 [Acidovorax soli]|nr:hypothetical protein [Acidovorax soli]